MPADGGEYENKLENLIVNGANISQLARIFQTDHRTIAGKLVSVRPSYRKGTATFYHIREAAPYICKPLGDMEEALKRMNPADLPPLLSKEFWNGQRARLDYEERTGALWKVSDVREKVSELLSAIKMAIMLTPDRIARDSELPKEIMDKLRSMTDQMILDLEKGIREKFTPSEETPSNASQSDEHVDATEDFFGDTGIGDGPDQAELDAEGL